MGREFPQPSPLFRFLAPGESGAAAVLFSVFGRAGVRMLMGLAPGLAAVGRDALERGQAAEDISLTTAFGHEGM